MQILAIDMGTGTQDILLFDSERPVENSIKMVLPSATEIAARRIRRATANRQAAILTGVNQGGGPCGWALESHLKAGLPAFATESAAVTFDDDLDRVREMAKTGDIVFTYDRTSGLASLIRRFDWIMWSHCAIVGTDGALFEATTAGTVQSSFDDLRSESLDVGLYRPQKELSSDEQAMVDQFCKSHLGIPYDWYAVIRIALNKNLGIPYRRKSMEVTGADLMYSNFLRLIAYA